jgi:hypothetical protein
VVVVLAFNVTSQVTVLEVVHPVQDENALPPAEAGAVSVTVVPGAYVRVKLVLPLDALLMSAGETLIETPLAGLVELTVSTQVPPK